jgi:hypothetical protein
MLVSAILCKTKNCRRNLSRHLFRTGHWQSVALVDFCATANVKIPINGHVFGVCGGIKNRLAGDFWGFARKGQKRIARSGACQYKLSLMAATSAGP